MASNQIEKIQITVRIVKKKRGCGSNGLSDWMNSLTTFRRV